ncbi:MAG: glycosyltransferase family 1 protein [Sphingobacteriales bacterium]|nr:MAG: glycosyltransferase family 1 protein [Sphingobacteriales bacterium]
MTAFKNKIRVLECIRQGQIGGGESHLLSLVENLDKSMYDPVVLSFTDGPMIDRLKALNISVHIIPTTKPFDIRVWKKVKQLMIDEKIDLVHAHGTRANSNVFRAAKSLKKPLAYTIHGWSFHVDQPFLVKKIRIAGEKLLVSRSDLNISVSVSNQKTGKDTIAGFKSVVINNGIDQHKFNADAQFADVRKELNIPADAVLSLFLARFTGHKQPLVLLNAFEKALQHNPDLFLLMVGDGDQKNEALEIVKKSGIGHRVIFQNFRQDVPAVLAAADIFILPSLWEGLPIGLLEAMSMGKAIIASDVDGTTDIIEHNKNGILIKLGDMDAALAPAILNMAKDEIARKTLGNKARETVKYNFNAADMTRKIEAAYQQLLNKET